LFKPTISKEAHDAIVASHVREADALRESIISLREQLAAAEERVVKANDALIEMTKAKTPAPVEVPKRSRRPVEDEENLPKRKPTTFDLSLIDPNDNEQIMLLVASEMPPGTKMTGAQAQMCIAKMRRNVIAAHERQHEFPTTGPKPPIEFVSRIDREIEEARAQGAQRVGA
jgi:hypothetical protein